MRENGKKVDEDYANAKLKGEAFQVIILCVNQLVDYGSFNWRGNLRIK